MRVLAVDTVTEMCSVALSVNGECIHKQEKAINRHSSIVLGMVEALLAEAGCSLQQLDVIVNDLGPGSFTGIRIGMGVTQGLAYGADLPMLGVDALTCLAQGVKDDTREEIFAAIDARMGQIYCAQFTQHGQQLSRRGEMRLLKPEELEQSELPVYGTGSAWDSYAEIMSNRLKVTAYAPERFPLARHGLQLGLLAAPTEWVAVGGLLPVYLRNDVAKVSNKSLV